MAFLAPLPRVATLGDRKRQSQGIAGFSLTPCVVMCRAASIARARCVMSAQIDRRRFGFDPIEWLMLLASIAVLGLVAHAI